MNLQDMPTASVRRHRQTASVTFRGDDVIIDGFHIDLKGEPLNAKSITMAICNLLSRCGAVIDGGPEVFCGGRVVMDSVSIGTPEGPQ